MHAPCPVTPFGGPSAVPLLVRCASGSCPCSASKAAAKGALASNLTFFQVRGNFCHASASMAPSRQLGHASPRWRLLAMIVVRMRRAWEF